LDVGVEVGLADAASRSTVPRVVIPGGSSYLGQALTDRLAARGDEVVVLTCGKARVAERRRGVTWEAQSIGRGRR
jgi:uncharacterized protein YbjT (DUF2867 family)